MYEAADDPYCYPGTSVLKNRLDLRTQGELDQFEAMITAQRAAEPLPAGDLDYDHYRAIHHHLFQDVFEWAGEVRSVRITKGDSTFCYPENIDAQTLPLKSLRPGARKRGPGGGGNRPSKWAEHRPSLPLRPSPRSPRGCARSMRRASCRCARAPLSPG
jgi:hypothetical protein